MQSIQRSGFPKIDLKSLETIRQRGSLIILTKSLVFENTFSVRFSPCTVNLDPKLREWIIDWQVTRTQVRF